MIYLQQLNAENLNRGVGSEGTITEKTGVRLQVREKPMGQLKLDGLGVVLVESNSVAWVGTLFCAAYLPRSGPG